MNKSAEAYVWGFLGFEMARIFVHKGYIPLRHGQRINAVNDPLFFWGFILVLALSIFAAVINFVLSIAEEYRERSIPNSGEEQAKFLAGEHTISYSSIWLFPVVSGLFGAWAFFVFSSGEFDFGSWFLGHWATAVLVLLVGTFISGWSLRVSQSGNTVLFKRLAMITGNLPLPVTCRQRGRSVLVLSAQSAEYSVPLHKLSKRNRELLKRVFNCGEAKR